MAVRSDFKDKPMLLALVDTMVTLSNNYYKEDNFEIKKVIRKHYQLIYSYLPKHINVNIPSDIFIFPNISSDIYLTFIAKDINITQDYSVLRSLVNADKGGRETKVSRYKRLFNYIFGRS